MTGMKGLQKRIEALETAMPDSLRLDCRTAKGRKLMTVGEYLAQPQPLDFRVASGSDLADAGGIVSYILKAKSCGAPRPTFEGGKTQAERYISERLTLFFDPVPNRRLEDFE